MKTARCLKCGFTMRGCFRKGAPKACPTCGYDKSQEDLRKMATAKIQEKQDNENNRQDDKTAGKGNIGSVKG